MDCIIFYGFKLLAYAFSAGQYYKLLLNAVSKLKRNNCNNLIRVALKILYGTVRACVCLSHTVNVTECRCDCILKKVIQDRETIIDPTWQIISCKLNHTATAIDVFNY